jgi:toxin ParE1/3/4
VKPVEFHEHAAREFEAAIEYYERAVPGLGSRFRRAVESAVLRIRRHPKRFAIHRKTPFRVCLVRRFPYVIYFHEREKLIYVMAVSHGHRRPGYWRYRV